MENQCLGLAEALNLTPVVKRVRLRSPWRQLSPYLRQGLGLAYSHHGDALKPPWPDLLIACGRASIPASLYIHRASRRGKNPKPTFTVQIQNPVISPRFFDLVIAPQHDGVTGDNVMTSHGGLHRITPAVLANAATGFAPQLAHLPKPYIAVLVGGSNGVYRFGAAEAARLALQLNKLAQQTGGSLLITPSRRTAKPTLCLLQAGLNNVPYYMWDGQGANPYFGILGMADHILVTADSVNMVTEACATGKPVQIIGLKGGSSKFDRFHQLFTREGYTRPFTGQLENWSYAPLNDMAAAAARVRQMMGF